MKNYALSLVMFLMVGIAQAQVAVANLSTMSQSELESLKIQLTIDIERESAFVESEQKRLADATRELLSMMLERDTTKDPAEKMILTSQIHQQQEYIDGLIVSINAGKTIISNWTMILSQVSQLLAVFLG